MVAGRNVLELELPLHVAKKEKKKDTKMQVRFPAATLNALQREQRAFSYILHICSHTFEPGSGFEQVQCCCYFLLLLLKMSRIRGGGGMGACEGFLS